VAAPQRYTLTISDHPWATPRYRLVAHSVVDVPIEVTPTLDGPLDGPPCVGCATESVADESAMAAAKGAAELFNTKLAATASGTTPPRFQVVDVTKVVTQVVAGTKYDLTLLGGLVTCPSKDPSTDLYEDAVLDAWVEQGVKEGKLNSFGDAPDMMYTGGSPLFDETTGQAESLYAYLRKAHQDEPWSTMCKVAAEDVKEYHVTVVHTPWMDPAFTIMSSDFDTMLDSNPGESIATMLGAPADKDHQKEGDDSITMSRMRPVGAVLMGIVALVGFVGAVAYFRHAGSRMEQSESDATVVPQEEAASIDVKQDEAEEVSLVAGDSMKAMV